MHRRTSSVFIVPFVLASVSLGGSAFAKKGHKAHVHGAASMNIAVDGEAVAIGLEVPGDDAFGFEHQPHGEKEQQAVRSALAVFRGKASELFQFPTASGCTLKEATIKAAQEAGANGGEPKAAAEARTAKTKPGEAEHADVDADYTFSCQKSPAGGVLKLGLFKAFPRIKSVKIQVVGSQQSGLTVHSDGEDIKL